MRSTPARPPCGPPSGQLVVLLRWPAPGRCKRRLAAGIGAVRAAAIQARLAAHVLQMAVAATQQLNSAPHLAPSLGGRIESVLAVSGLGARAAARWGRSCGISRTVLQGQGALGARLQRQVMRARREGAGAVVLIGGDLPQLGAVDLVQAFGLLRHHPVVLGPACDGGYWLIGLRQRSPQLFAGHGEAISWGSAAVFAQTLAACDATGLLPALLPRRADLDRPEDLERWR